MARTKKTDDAATPLSDEEIEHITTARDEAKAKLDDPNLDQEDRTALESAIAGYEALLG